jgi:hypothetical protein
MAERGYPHHLVRDELGLLFKRVIGRPDYELRPQADR